MNMVEINNATKAKIDLKTMKKAAEKFLAAYRLNKKDVSIAFVGEARMKTLNGRYRRKDKVTDVLSFEGEGDFFGEILLCYPQIKRQAAESGKTIRAELIFILIHGLLHLSGMSDETEKGRLAMIKKGEEIIKSLKLC